MDAEDDEFEVTAEMLIHEDVDDEQTLAEVEAELSAGEVEEEVSDLQQESELPLEEILKRYGYSLAGNPPPVSEEKVGEKEEEEEKEEVMESRGIKRERFRDATADEEDDEESSSIVLKKINVEKTLLQETAIQNTSDTVILNKETPSVRHLKNSGDLELCKEPSFMAGATSSITATSQHHNEHNINRSNPITSPQQSEDAVNACLSSVHHQSTIVPSSLHPYSATTLLDTDPLKDPSHLLLDEHETSLQIASSLVVDSEGLGSVSQGSDGIPLSQTGSSVYMPSGVHPLLGDDPLLASGGRGGREGVIGEDGMVRQGNRFLSSRGAHQQLDKSPNFTDGYSSDAQFSSDGQSNTPSSTSTSSQVSSFSSSYSSGPSRMPNTSSDIKSRLRAEVPERRSMRLMANDEKLIDSYFSNYSDDEEGDDEYVPPAADDWKQEIRVGPSYQVQVADSPCREPCMVNSKRETPTDCLLWRPQCSEDKVISYLKTVSTVLKPDSAINSWEVEQAMKLLQDCDHNVQRAVDLVQQQGLPPGTRAWSEEECEEFERGFLSFHQLLARVLQREQILGLRVSGKDFYQLSKVVPSRTVKELVEFYYFWKKSKRYEDFVQHGKIGKRKVTFQPGQVYDFMDNYLNYQDASAPELHYATSTVSAEHKRETA